MTRAFTLIELLAMLVILAMVAGLCAPSLLRTSEQARVQEALHQAVELDMMARASAPALGPIRMVDLGSAIALEQIASGEILTRRELSVELTLQRVPHGSIVAAIDFDGRSCSDDYMILATSGVFQTTQSICGLTGWPLTNGAVR